MVHLNEEQKRFYEENGYVVLKNVLSEGDLSAISREYDNLFKRKNQEKMESSWVGSDDNDRKHDKAVTVKGIHNLQFHHAVFSKYIFNDNLLDALEDVMKTKNIILHHTKAHYKPPEKGASYPMHQDYHYFPYEKDSVVASFLHLDAADSENGCLHVYPGSHKLGPQEDVGAKEGNYHYVDQNKFSILNAKPVIAERGDVVIFSYLLIHGSTPNSSQRPRRMLLMQTAAAEDRRLTAGSTQPGYGWLLRGVNVERDASISKRFDS